MKQGWEIRKLKEIGITQTGTTPKTSEKENFGEYIPFIKPADVDFEGNGKLRYDNDGLSEIGLSKSRKIESNSIFMVCIGATIGKVGFSEKDASCNQQINTLTLGKEYCPKFFYYGMTTKEFQDKVLLEGKGAQATLPIINKSKWENLTLPFPNSLPEQQRIVSILDEAFAAIAKAKANAEQNLKNAKELFDSYLQDLFTNLFQKNDKKTVSELAKVIGGYSFKSTDFKKEGKYQVIRMGNVRPGIIRENESPVFIDELDEKALSKALLLPNDVIITQTGTKKKRDYGFTVMIEKENYLLNQRIASIRFSDKCLPKFFLYFSWTNIFKDQYFANETGTVGQGNVGIGAITEAIVPLISVNEQKMIIDRIDSVRIEVQKLEAVYQKKIADLEELKKSILQKAFAGELHSPEGARYANDGHSPSDKKKSITSPEGV